MTNPFIARKGLIALDSSSFEGTLEVSGTLSSPVEAKLTASWAVSASYSTGTATSSVSLVAITASYVDAESIQYRGTTVALGTGTQNSATNTWQAVNQNIDVETSSYWSHVGATGDYSCLSSGYYNVYAQAYIQKTGGTAANGGIRFTVNGVPVSASYAAYTYGSNNIGTNLTATVVDYFMSGSTLRFEFAGASTKIQTTTQPVVGGMFTYGSKIIIARA